ncbi:glycosyltransferase family 4 protein, partial [Patescibacteria group bacterium]|nr:glycosyltransferase family 4 protein [Patescibacteria group bacterium]
PFNWKRISCLTKGPRIFRYIYFIIVSLFQVKKFSPDVIYTRDVGVAFVYNTLGYTVMYEIHKPFETTVGNYLFRLLSKKIKIVAISQALKEFVIKKYDIYSNDVLVAHDGVFLEKYTVVDKKIVRQNLCKELSVNPEEKLLLYSSNLYKGKGLGIIVHLAKKYPKYHFVIMGDKGIDIEVNLSNIHYIGYKSIPEVPKYIMSADILLLPFTKQLKTWKYHSALKMFEYLAAEVPALVSSIGSIKEIFNDNNSYLFNPEDLSTAVEQIDIIFNNYTKAQEKALQARTDVKYYTWEKRAEAILAFIEK